jgi:hypothetical protein
MRNLLTPEDVVNEASLTYVDRIGNESAQVYNLIPNDTTHLNAWGSVVFGRMVADLLLQQKADLGQYFAPNETLSDEIWNGIPAKQ